MLPGQVFINPSPFLQVRWVPVIRSLEFLDQVQEDCNAAQRARQTGKLII